MAGRKTDPVDLAGLLRARCERPRRRAAEQRDELAPLHEITLSTALADALPVRLPSRLALMSLLCSQKPLKLYRF